MLKRTLCLLFTVAAAFSMATVTFAATSETVQTQTASNTQSESPVIYIDEQPISDSGLTIVNGVTYMPLSYFFPAALPGSTVGWSGDYVVASGTTAEGKTLSVAARPGDCYLVANGRYLYVANEVRTINGLAMAPVVVMAEIFNGTAFWDTKGNCHVVLGEGLLTSGSEYYNSEMVDLLARLIYAEAGNQPMKGKIAVGNVIFNRVKDSRFPSTLYEVIYARNQFSVVNTGAINRTPSQEAVIAAKLSIEGANVVGGALYFNRSGLDCWASRNRTYVATIGAHDFYA